MTPCPSNFPQELELREVSYQFLNFSEGEESSQGRWAKRPSVDGKGRIEYGPAASHGRSARAWRGRPAPSGYIEEPHKAVACRMTACAAQWGWQPGRTARRNIGELVAW